MTENVAPYGLKLKGSVDVAEGLSASKGADGTWLHFKSSREKHCTFCIENKFFGICALAMLEWVQDRLKEQEDRELSRHGLTKEEGKRRKNNGNNRI